MDPVLPPDVGTFVCAKRIEFDKDKRIESWLLCIAEYRVRWEDVSEEDWRRVPLGAPYPFEYQFVPETRGKEG